MEVDEQSRTVNLLPNDFWPVCWTGPRNEIIRVSYLTDRIFAGSWQTHGIFKKPDLISSVKTSNSKCSNLI